MLICIVMNATRGDSLKGSIMGAVLIIVAIGCDGSGLKTTRYSLAEVHYFPALSSRLLKTCFEGMHREGLLSAGTWLRSRTNHFASTTGLVNALGC